jgi:phosphogluconate dehydratase
VPLLARVYPNGTADVNHFHAAGGLGFVMQDLIAAGLLHTDVNTILGRGLEKFCVEPFADEQRIAWKPASSASLDNDILRSCAEPFDAEGGLRLVEGNLGRAITKVSAVAAEHCRIEAEAVVFTTMDEFVEAFKAGNLDHDLVAVLPYQGPSANGMPELHKLTPFLSVLQNRGHSVALLTDGRMSGAFGKVLAAIQVTPEAVVGGLIGRIRNGDMIHIDAEGGILQATPREGCLEDRPPLDPDLSAGHFGMGRELFAAFRKQVAGAEAGASIF